MSTSEQFLHSIGSTSEDMGLADPLVNVLAFDVLAACLASTILSRISLGGRGATGGGGGFLIGYKVRGLSE